MLEDLVNFNLKPYDKPYERPIREKIGDVDDSVRVAVLEYGSKRCGKRYPQEKIFLADIDFNDIISFDELIDFEKLLIFWYNDDHIITDIEIYDITPDLDILKDDYEVIRDMIETGRAHLISEGDTQYLGAGLIGGKSEAPNSDRLARNRAFVFKKKYLQKIIRELGYTCRI